MEESIVGEQGSLFVTGRTQIANTATQVISSVQRPQVGMHVKNLLTNGIIYIGRSDVSATTGYPLEPGDSLKIEIDNTDLIYALAAVNGQYLHYMIL